MHILRSIKAKVTLAFASTIVLWALLCAISLFAIQQLDGHSDKLYSTNLLGVNALAETSQTYATMLANIRGRLNAGKPNDIQALASELTHDRETLNQQWSDYYPNRVSSEAELQQARESYKTFQGLGPRLDKFVDILGQGNPSMANTFYNAQLSMPLTAAGKALYDLRNSQIAAAKGVHQQSNQTAQWLSWLIGGAGAAAILVGLVVATVLVRLITRPLDQAKHFAEAIGQGRLDNDIPHQRRDEFGDMLAALAGMQQRLVDTVADVRSTSEAVSASASQIASGSDELSSRTQSQAANLQQTSASMEQMTATVKQNADNAAEAEAVSNEVQTRADEGSVVVQKAVAAMAAIDASSRKINDIVGLIEDIAFQTNLLALNASVEAARAGEQGRGFAVVATEVRNLANRSASAVEEIKTLVADSTRKVTDGSEQVTLSGQTLEKITASVHRVSELISEIATASREQASGIEQVNRAVSDMDSSTQENAALVEESAAAGRELETRSRDLFAKMAFFKLAAAAPLVARAPVEPPPATATAVLATQHAPDSSAARPSRPDSSTFVARTDASKDLSVEQDDDPQEWATF
ncbi:methyl-accepting chemotaxis protein [Salinisphaera sp. SPP-AMP-43]|uniref:methyl-accepting chemotaxis protein n=1 Tax=Salinisphaera sp. SPP-AMP-43 TaxID=3121288 RepID=UPI003C6E8D2A